MFIPAIRKSVPSNLQRIAARVTYRSKTKINFGERYSKSVLLSTSVSNLTTYRAYNNESSSQPVRNHLPMLIDGSAIIGPSPLTPFKLLYLSIFRITPYIDKEFDIAEFLKGAKHAIIIISNALANRDFESLHGLASEDMIEKLRTRIESLTTDQRQLIQFNEDDILFYVLSDIAATKDKEYSIDITIICHYVQDLKNKKTGSIMEAMNLSQSVGQLICNYTFTRKYVNNVGGPWIATFINHYSTS